MTYAALRELNARLSDIEADHAFVSRAASLRPRLGGILMWEAESEEISLARAFLSANDSRPEAIYGALLVRAVASLERYIRKAVEATAQAIGANARTVDRLPEKFARRHIELTGRALGSLSSPLDYLDLDAGKLIDNLLTCRPNGGELRINGVVFAQAVSSAKPEAIEKALKQLDLDEWWDLIGASASIRTSTGTKKAREGANAARKKLSDVCRWRNQIAHGGDEEIAVSSNDLQEIVTFLRAFATEMDAYLEAQARPTRKA